MPRASTIDRLPADIKDRLHELLRDPRITQLEATARINEILAEDGLPDRVSKSSINRYSLRMEEVGARLRQSREVAAMWIGKLGAAPQGEVGLLLNEIVRNLAFDSAMQLAEGEEPAPPKLIKELSIAVERLERAASEGTRRAEQIKRQAAEEATAAAAARIESAAQARGLSAEDVQFWREQVLMGL